MELKPFILDNPQHHMAAAALWNAACGPELAIRPAVVHFNTRPSRGVLQAGRLAVADGQAAGFVLASAFPGGAPDEAPADRGWVDALAVSPAFQHQGMGGILLSWAEAWLRDQGCTRFRLGSSLRPFAPGLPSALGSERFFRNRGYADEPNAALTWDVARDLRGYASPPGAAPDDACLVRPAAPGEQSVLLAFLDREFPGRWHFECWEHLAAGGRLTDYLLLWVGQALTGCCRLTFEDSLRPLDVFFPRRLPRPWGQLGAIGVRASQRGRGYGGLLLDAGLRRLRDAGVAGCVIDWTGLLEFYGKFGFQPYQQYAMLIKAQA